MMTTAQTPDFWPSGSHGELQRGTRGGLCRWLVRPVAKAEPGAPKLAAAT